MADRTPNPAQAAWAKYSELKDDKARTAFLRTLPPILRNQIVQHAARTGQATSATRTAGAEAAYGGQRAAGTRSMTMSRGGGQQTELSGGTAPAGPGPGVTPEQWTYLHTFDPATGKNAFGRTAEDQAKFDKVFSSPEWGAKLKGLNFGDTGVNIDWAALQNMNTGDLGGGSSGSVRLPSGGTGAGKVAPPPGRGSVVGPTTYTPWDSTKNPSVTPQNIRSYQVPRSYNPQAGLPGQMQAPTPYANRDYQQIRPQGGLTQQQGQQRAQLQDAMAKWQPVTKQTLPTINSFAANPSPTAGNPMRTVDASRQNTLPGGVPMTSGADLFNRARAGVSGLGAPQGPAGGAGFMPPAGDWRQAMAPTNPLAAKYGIGK